jgi:hypothetical protein
MGCSLLSIVEIFVYLSLMIHSAFRKVYEKYRPQEPSNVIQVIAPELKNQQHILVESTTPKMIRIISAQSQAQDQNKIAETLNLLMRNVEEIQKQVYEANQKNDAKFAKIEARFARNEERTSGSLTFEDL